MCNIKRCNYCGKLGGKDDIKDIIYGLYAQYENICVDCYCKNENISEKKVKV